MEDGTKKQLYLKWWLWGLFAVMLLVAIVFCYKYYDATINHTAKLIAKDESALSGTTKYYTKSEICEILLEATAGDIGEGEKIDFISFEKRNLVIAVDLSEINPSPRTYKRLAQIRTGSITDTVLEYPEFDRYWDSVIVDFGDIGYYQGYRNMVDKSTYSRHFKSPLELYGFYFENNDDFDATYSTAFDFTIEEWFENLYAEGVEHLLPTLSYSDIEIRGHLLKLSQSKHVYYLCHLNQYGDIDSVMMSGTSNGSVLADFEVDFSIERFIMSIHPEYSDDEMRVVLREIFYNNEPVSFTIDGTDYSIILDSELRFMLIASPEKISVIEKIQGEVMPIQK